MSPCHCRCQLDLDTVLQSKIQENIEIIKPSFICVQGLIGLGMSLEVVFNKPLKHPSDACLYICT